MSTYRKATVTFESSPLPSHAGWWFHEETDTCVQVFDLRGSTMGLMVNTDGTNYVPLRLAKLPRGKWYSSEQADPDEALNLIKSPKTVELGKEWFKKLIRRPGQ